MEKGEPYRRMLRRHDGAVPVHLVGERMGLSVWHYGAGVALVASIAYIGTWLVNFLPPPLAALTGSGPDAPMVRHIASLVWAGGLTLCLGWLLTRQGRDLMSLVAPGRPLDARLFLRSVAVYAAAFLPIVMMGVQQGHVSTGTVGLALLWLPVMGTLILFQSFVEEIIYRGYLTQAFQVLSGSAVLAAIPVAILFVLLHEGGNWEGGWGRKLSLLLISLGLSYITCRLGRLEAAIGVRFAHNSLIYLLMAQPAGFAAEGALMEGMANGAGPLDVEALLSILLLQGALFASYWFLGLQSGFIEHGWRGAPDKEEW
ncbi:CPBP family intramembrane glutamic endopeptidase [Niveispirillum irakense]|uniref:CPBP family intramembrane glutamic endopeptidase n=1 Tax=Niveispirillum irakense TaxID=34011 RepID=UPI000403DF2D|nr:CPBP family intramembrane glutamic endopeptidase [Niveispirillum irakense]